MKLENYYLNLDKVGTLEKEEREVIHRYYHDMLHYFHDGRTFMAQSIFLTLITHDYLVDVRDKKISKILDEN